MPSYCLVVVVLNRSQTLHSSAGVKVEDVVSVKKPGGHAEIVSHAARTSLHVEKAKSDSKERTVRGPPCLRLLASGDVCHSVLRVFAVFAVRVHNAVYFAAASSWHTCAATSGRLYWRC
jgi:hypothetical protein